MVRHGHSHIDDKDDKGEGVRRSQRSKRSVFESLNEQTISPSLRDYLVQTANKELERQHRECSEPTTAARPKRRTATIQAENNMEAEHELLSHIQQDGDDVVDMYSRVKRKRTASHSGEYAQTSRRTAAQTYSELQLEGAAAAGGHDDFELQGPGTSTATTVPSIQPSITEESSNQSSLDGRVVGGRMLRARPSAVITAVTPSGTVPKVVVRNSASCDDTEDSENEDGHRRYHMRESRPMTQRYQVVFESSATSRQWRPPATDEPAYNSPAQRRSRGRDRSRCRRSRLFSSQRPRSRRASSSSDSDRDAARFDERISRDLQRSRSRFQPLNVTSSDARSFQARRIESAGGSGRSCADIDPMHLDSKTDFTCVGGLQSHLRSLKEMVLFPLMYPEVFDKFDITPPRGVIFYGPPGTGKTLLARALANECSRGERRVAFFMRKGADCLSKWVGESERQLRILFDQAYAMRPSIIFFDEIDGLAPVRSSRQDQIHSSIVSTLLALLDGLDQRQDVIVIGATNRLDAIDPALRRPGRFDRELRFSLPDAKSREEIIRIHTRGWNPQPDESMIGKLAMDSVGYCGADLKGLCTEAALAALQRCFPQIYEAKDRLQLDMTKIQVTSPDFALATARIAPSSQRSLDVCQRPLPARLHPLLRTTLDAILETMVPDVFKPDTRHTHPQRLATLLLSAPSPAHGQTTFLAPALLHALDHLPVHPLTLHGVHASTTRSVEEAIAEVVHAALKHSPSVIYIPQIELWHAALPSSAWLTLQSLLQQVDPTASLLLLATTHVAVEEMDEGVLSVFSTGHRVELCSPSTEDRRSYYASLLNEEGISRRLEEKRGRAPVSPASQEQLPVAPCLPVRQLTATEQKALERADEAVMRELRIFLREMLGRLVRDRRFVAFSRPIDTNEVDDYLDVIETPMDLSTMMTKIDQHKYECVSEWLADIDLICSNALEYNPDVDLEDKLIRHRACGLRDAAYALIETELDQDFERKCRAIIEARQRRGAAGPVSAPPSFVNTLPPLQAPRRATRSSGPAEESGLVDSVAADSAVDTVATTSRGKARRVGTKRRHRKEPAWCPRRRAAAIRRKYAAHRRNNALLRMPSVEVDTAATPESEMTSESKSSPVSDATSSIDEEVAVPTQRALNDVLQRVLHQTSDWPLLRLDSLYLALEATILQCDAAADMAVALKHTLQTQERIG